jgi:4-alpha-glucanotransferase
MSGTHDTDTMASWWEHAPAEERRALLALPFLSRFGFQAATPWSAVVRDALLEQLYRAGSDDLVLPIQDIFGWPDRINTPGTITDQNWRWRLPWPVDEMIDLPEPAERASVCGRLARDTGRT